MTLTHLICVFHPMNLFTQILKVIEGGLGCDGVDKQETLAILHVQIPHGCELLRASSIQYFQHALVPVHLNVLEQNTDPSVKRITASGTVHHPHLTACLRPSPSPSFWAVQGCNSSGNYLKSGKCPSPQKCFSDSQITCIFTLSYPDSDRNSKISEYITFLMF